MQTKSKWIITSICLFMIASSYQDITNGTSLGTKQKDVTQDQAIELKHVKVIKHTVENGETFLSIADQINHSQTQLDIEQMKQDFQRINHTKPKRIKNGYSYYFPLYK